VLKARVHSAEVQDLKRASSSCWRSTRGIVCPSASLTCGWTLATPEKARAQTGCRRCSGMDGRDRTTSTKAGSG
jgi:hypothetical protein